MPFGGVLHSLPSRIYNTNTKINHASIFCVQGMSRDAASSPEAILEWVEASVDALAVMRKELAGGRKKIPSLSEGGGPG